MHNAISLRSLFSDLNCWEKLRFHNASKTFNVASETFNLVFFVFKGVVFLLGVYSNQSRGSYVYTIHIYIYIYIYTHSISQKLVHPRG